MVHVQLRILDIPPIAFGGHLTYNGLVLVFDLTNRDTLQAIPEFAKHAVEKHSSDNPLAMILVGTKKDRESERSVNETEIRQIRENLNKYDTNIPYIETSAKTGEAIDQMYNELARKMIVNHETLNPRTSEEIEPSYIFKVAMIGEQGVGVSSLIRRSIGLDYYSDSINIGIEFYEKILELEPYPAAPIDVSVDKLLDDPAAPIDVLADELIEEKAIDERLEFPKITTEPTAPSGPPAEPILHPTITSTAPGAPPTSHPDVTVSGPSKKSKKRLRESVRERRSPIFDEKDDFITDSKSEDRIEDQLIRDFAVSYYDRMNPSRNFPLRVKIAKKVIDLEAAKEIRHVEGQLEIEREETELPIVRVVPIFPGCIVTPLEAAVNIEKDQTVFFYVTPLAYGNIEGKVEFWHHGQKIAVSETPATVEKQTIAKIFATAGTAVAVIPSALDFLGFDINGTIKNTFETNRPALGRFIDTLGGLWVLEVILLIGFLFFGYYFYRMKLPREAEQPNLMYVG